MARHEADREDLMREAVSLVRRVELCCPSQREPIVIGFRNNGNWSVYFGGDPVFHFDNQRRLRRAFVDGQLYRSQGKTLTRLTRQRSSEATRLLRHDLSSTELTDFWSCAAALLEQLLDAIRDKSVQVLQRIPSGWEFDGDLIGVLASLLSSPMRLSAPLKK